MSTGVDYRQRVLELMRGYRSAHVLISCAELGVFEALRGVRATVEELEKRLDTNTAALERLLNTAVALGLLEKVAAGYVNSPIAATCLAGEDPFYLGNLVRREGAFYRRWSRLTEAVRTGKRPEENVGDEHNDGWVRDFEMALLDIARTAAPAVAQALEPLLPQNIERPVRVLDVGGGHGAYSVALARRNPTLEAVVFDLPPVIEVAPAIAHTDDLAGRVLFRAGDFKVDDLGADFDLALLFGVLVSETPADATALLCKVRKALAPGGIVAIRELFLDTERTGPVDATLFDLHMLPSTGAGEAHTLDTVMNWLKAANLSEPEILALPPPEQSSLLIARKPVA